jgi:hypothetical protein
MPPYTPEVAVLHESRSWGQLSYKFRDGLYP